MMLIRTSTESWNAEYTVQGNRDAQIVRIKSRSSITVVIAKIMENLPLVGKTVTYYISVPNYGIALPEIESLNESASRTTRATTSRTMKIISSPTSRRSSWLITIRLHLQRLTVTTSRCSTMRWILILPTQLRH